MNGILSRQPAPIRISAAAGLAQLLRGISALAATVALGCATEPPSGNVPTPLPIDASAGAPIALLNGSAQRARVLLDRSGAVHLIISVRQDQTVNELVIDDDHVSQRRIVASTRSPTSIDAGVDAHERIHVLLDGEHLFLEDGTWRSGDTPWNTYGLAASKAQLVTAPSGLIWVFQVSGADLGSPLRTDLVELGWAAGVPPLVPVVTRGTRLAVVAESDHGYGPLWLVEPHGREDTFLAGASADENGLVHIVYGSVSHGITARFSPREARVTWSMLTDASQEQREVREIAGSPAPDGSVAMYQLGDVQPLPASLCREVVVATGPSEFRAICARLPDARADGEGLFVVYLLDQSGVWRGPITIVSPAPSVLGPAQHLLAFGSGGPGKPVVVWSTVRGAAAAWLKFAEKAQGAEP